MFFNGKVLSVFIFIILVFPFEDTCLEIENPQEYMGEDFFKIQPKRSPRLLTTRFGKRRLITTRMGKRDGGNIGSNLEGTADGINWALENNREKRRPLITTRMGKRRLITTRMGKRDGGFIGSSGSNLEGTVDGINRALENNREKRRPLITTRMGKRRLITTRMGKRDGGYV